MEPPDEFQQAMKELSRTQIWSVWQTGKMGAALNDEEARLYNILLEHPENADLWEHLDVASDDDIVINRVNVVLHVLFHLGVENQLAMNDPPAVRQVLNVLLQKGLGRHEAIHGLANALVAETFQIMHDKRPYNEERYLRELRKIPLSIPDRRRKRK